MTSLAELQAQFRSFLIGGDPAIEQLTMGSERLHVYADAYRLRLQEVLEEDFPGLRGMVGDGAFRALAGAYIDAHPSDHPSVRWFGRRIGAFLRDTPPYSEQSVLAAMAEFEWAQGEVLDAADSPALGADELAGIPPADWPRMRIGFQDALQRLDLSWNAPPLWQAVHDDSNSPPVPKRCEPPLAWLLWRKDLRVHWRSLDDDERFALDAARTGFTFGDICEELLGRTRDDRVPLLAAGYLKRWIGDELVARIDLANEQPPT